MDTPRALEDISTADLGGQIVRGRVGTPDRGFLDLIAIVGSPAAQLGMPLRFDRDDDGRLGMGLWRSPVDPLLPRLP